MEATALVCQVTGKKINIKQIKRSCSTAGDAPTDPRMQEPRHPGSEAHLLLPINLLFLMTHALHTQLPFVLPFISKYAN